MGGTDSRIETVREFRAMILYFSATGNTRYAAERIAEATGDEAVSLQDIAEYPFNGASVVLITVRGGRFGGAA